MNEINRTKKELAFANKQLYNSKATNFGDEKALEARHADEIERSIKVVETIGIQKRVLEEENEELKSRISELLAEREQVHGDTRKRFDQVNEHGVPPLNFAQKSSGRKFM